MVFQHSGAQVFDLGGGFHYSGSYPMVFQHSDSPHTAAPTYTTVHLYPVTPMTLSDPHHLISNPLDCPPNGTTR